MDKENRRKFFFDFAAEMGFDPLQPDNWARVTANQIIAKNVTPPQISQHFVYLNF